LWQETAASASPIHQKRADRQLESPSCIRVGVVFPG
jgi:hypothetical protein